MEDSEVEQFYAWLSQGIERGWVSDAVCATHEGLPLTPEEEIEWQGGYDPCTPGIRIWMS